MLVEEICRDVSRQTQGCSRASRKREKGKTQFRNKRAPGRWLAVLPNCACAGNQPCPGTGPWRQRTASRRRMKAMHGWSPPQGWRWTAALALRARTVLRGALAGKGTCLCLTFRWRFIAPRGHFLCHQAYEFFSRMSLRQLLTMFLNASIEIFAVISIASYLVNSVFSTIHPCQINRGEIGPNRVI